MANKISENQLQYIMWQNKSAEFYIAARCCYRRKLYAPSAFFAQQAIEQLLKATLIYWDKSFKPEGAGHKLKRMSRTIQNKVPGQKSFAVPDYLYHENRYQSVSRYPNQGKGLGIPATFLSDLDRLFADIVEMVPFQFNSQLSHTLSGKDWSKLLELRSRNREMRRLRRHVGANLRYPGGRD